MRIRDRIVRIPYYLARAKSRCVAGLIPQSRLRREVLSVCIGVLNRGGRRLENCIRSLRVQSLPERCVDITIADMGSGPEIEQELRAIARQYKVRLILMHQVAPQWSRAFVVNVAAKYGHPAARFLLLTDIDMVFAHNFAETVLRTQMGFGGAFVCGNWLMLPEGAIQDTMDVVADFQALKTTGTWYEGGAGAGGFQSVPKPWFIEVHGYDERLTGWGVQDLDLVKRARASGLDIIVVDRKTTLLHQWHETEESLARARGQHDAFVAETTLNSRLYRECTSIVRNPNGWAELPQGSEIV